MRLLRTCGDRDLEARRLFPRAQRGGFSDTSERIFKTVPKFGFNLVASVTNRYSGVLSLAKGQSSVPRDRRGWDTPGFLSLGTAIQARTGSRF